MTPDDLLRLYPRETLRWLRRRLRMSQLDFAEHIGVGTQAVAGWESRLHGIGVPNRVHLAALLLPHLATPEGEAFMGSLGRASAGEG